MEDGYSSVLTITPFMVGCLPSLFKDLVTMVVIRRIYGKGSSV